MFRQIRWLVYLWVCWVVDVLHRCWVFLDVLRICAEFWVERKGTRLPGARIYIIFLKEHYPLEFVCSCWFFTMTGVSSVFFALKCALSQPLLDCIFVSLHAAWLDKAVRMICLPIQTVFACCLRWSSIAFKPMIKSRIKICPWWSGRLGIELVRLQSREVWWMVSHHRPSNVVSKHGDVRDIVGYSPTILEPIPAKVWWTMGSC